MHAIRPLVGSQGLGQNNSSQVKTVYKMSEEDQNQMRIVTAQAIESQLKKMLAEIILTITLAMTQKNL